MIKRSFSRFFFLSFFFLNFVGIIYGAEKKDTLGIQPIEKFIPFLKSDYLPDCFNGLNRYDVQKLVTQGKLRADWTVFSVKYDNFNDVLYLYSNNNCDDIERILLKYLYYQGIPHVLMYKQKVVNSNSFGRLKVYRLVEDEWVRGRQVDVTWQQLFQLSERDIKRLHDVDQFPKYLLRFEHDHIVFDIPWRLYTFGEGSDVDGFSMSGGKQPVRMPYHFFLR
ncbi:MAG: hypothetical protein JJT77_00905 [Crocinitomicaceae bacterium]|nr:hypothetical protein [Crocinitomicaceae bacterium]